MTAYPSNTKKPNHPTMQPSGFPPDDVSVFAMICSSLCLLPGMIPFHDLLQHRHTSTASDHLQTHSYHSCPQHKEWQSVYNEQRVSSSQYQS